MLISIRHALITTNTSFMEPTCNLDRLRHSKNRQIIPELFSNNCIIIIVLHFSTGWLQQARQWQEFELVASFVRPKLHVMKLLHKTSTAKKMPREEIWEVTFLEAN